MPGLRFFLALFVVSVIHVFAVRLLPAFPRYTDLFLVVLVLNALHGRSTPAFLGGLAAGLVEDALSGGLYGLHSFVGTLVGYGAARLAKLLFIQQLAVVGLFVALSAALQQTLLVALRLFLLADPEIPSLRWVAVKAVGCGVAGAGLVVLDRQLKRRVRSWRRRRGSKLEMERGI